VAQRFAVAVRERLERVRAASEERQAVDGALDERFAGSMLQSVA